jgi:hypothetical protein
MGSQNMRHDSGLIRQYIFRYSSHNKEPVRVFGMQWLMERGLLLPKAPPSGKRLLPGSFDSAKQTKLGCSCDTPRNDLNHSTVIPPKNKSNCNLIFPVFQKPFSTLFSLCTPHDATKPPSLLNCTSLHLTKTGSTTRPHNAPPHQPRRR